MNKLGLAGFDNWNWITRRLATGGGPVTADDVQWLIDQGITHMIDCREEQDHLPPSSQLRYLFNPTADDGQPKPTSWFKASLMFAEGPLIEAYLMGGHHPKLYVHCAAGINRGPSTAYCILRALTGMAHDDAKALIILHRPIDITGIRYADDADKALQELGYE